MPDFSSFSEFHFLRPAWLSGIVLAAFFYVVIRHRNNLDRQWRDVIAPHLLESLKVSDGRASWFRPVHLTTLAMSLGCLGMAGPTWSREETPFTEDTAPMVIVMDLSRSMDAIDVSPTRLERAKHKARDLLELREGARTALVVYSGTAHAVLPLTDDPAILEIFVADLSTGLMPVAGKEPSRALNVAADILQRDTVPGTIVFLTDGIGAEFASDFASYTSGSRDQIMVLAFGTIEGGPIRAGENRFVRDAGGQVIATLDKEGLQTLARESGADVVSATVDDADVQRVQRRAQSHLQQVLSDTTNARWRDFGYYLVIPVALLTLFWFRRGWTVNWAGIVILPLLLAGCDVGSGPGQTTSLGERFAGLWVTPDQLGRIYFERGEYVRAAELFEDPMWRAIAASRGDDLDAAIDAFARVGSAEASLGLANALARKGLYEDALLSYDDALRGRPDWDAALENRATVAALIPPPEEESDAPPGNPNEPTFEADDYTIDEEQDPEGGTPGEVPMEGLSDEQIAEMWMRRLQTSPGQFMRAKFAIQAANAAAERDGGGR